jgi:4-amino-4-deoxy-L-arabinose transferase-like glycosyltransferase
MNFFIRKTFKRGSVPQATLLLGALILALIVLHAVSLRLYPPVFVDEAILISRAWAWLQSGLNFGPLEAGVFDKRFDGYWTFHPLIPTWFHALFVQLFGLDLRLLRIASLFCGTVLLIAVFAISYQLSASSRCGFIAFLLVIVSFSFLLSAHHIRYDIIVAALAFGAIAIHLTASKRKSVLLSILSGLLLGMAFEVHVNAVIYGPVIFSLFLTEERWRFYRQRVFWGFVGGAAIPLAWYLWAHVVRYPEAYFGIGRAMAGTHYPPLLLGNPLALIMAIAEMGRYLLILTQFRIAVSLVAGFMLWQRRLARKDLLMFLVGFLSFGLMVKNKMDYYLILIAPFADIVLARWIEEFLFQKKPLSYRWKLERALTIALLAASLLFSLAVFFVTFLFPPLNETRRVAERIERVIPAGGSLMGSQLYWFDLHQYRYISWQQIIAHQKTYPERTFDDAMMDLRPDVLVIDNHLRDFILDDVTPPSQGGLQRYFWERRLRKEDVEAFLTLRGTLREQVKTGTSTIEIYRINWGSAE